MSNIQVAVEDQNGNVVTGATGAIELVLIGTSGENNLGVTSFSSGVASFNNIVFQTAGTYVLASNAPGYAGVRSNAFTVTSQVVPVAPVISPSTGSYTTAQAVTITDSTSGAVIHYTTDGSTPTAASATYSGAFTVSSTTTVQAVAVANTLTSSAAGATLTISPAQLVFLSQPPSMTVGSVLGSLQVAAEDQSGNVLTSVNSAVEIILMGSTSQTVLSVVAFKNGVATFTNLPYSTVGTYTLSANGPGFPGKLSSSFSVTAKSASSSSTTSSSSSTATTASSTSSTTSTSSATASTTSSTTTSSSSTATAIPANLFGMSVNKSALEQLNMPYTYGTTRTWDVYPGLSWVELNPAQGVYDFTSLDNFIAYNAETNQADIIYTFGMVAPWASSNSANTACHNGTGTCSPPGSLSVWDSYVTAVVTHALGKIHIWELWNEPNDPGYYSGDIPTMVTMAQHAYTIIKALDPTAIVISPASTGGYGPGWLNSFLAAGGGNYVDVIGFHGYGDTTAESVVPVIAATKAVMAANGVNKPMWDTESSWAGSNSIPASLTDQSSFVGKYYLLHWANGVSRFLWYMYDNPTWGGLWDSSTGIHPAGIAYGQVKNWMAGATMTQNCAADASATYTCDLARSNGYKARVVWNSTQSVQYTTATAYTQYRDLTGAITSLTAGQVITVGNQPLLLETGSSPYPN